MVFTPPKNYTNNKHYKNSKLYNELKKDYEKIMNNRSSLYNLVEEYSNTISILETQLKEQNNILEDKDSVIQYWKTTCDNLIQKNNKNKISQSVDSFSELNYLKKKEIEWQDYANDFAQELEDINKDYDKTKTDLYNTQKELEKTQLELYKTNELNISKQSDYDEINNEIKNLKTKLNNSYKKCDSLVYAFNNENTKLQEELSETKYNYSQLKTKYNNIVSDFSEMDNFIQSQDKQLTDYKTNNTNLAKKLNDTNQQFKNKQEDFQITIERLREIISTKNHTIKKFEKEILSLQKNNENTCRTNMKNADLVDKSTTTESCSEPSFYLIENHDYQ